MQKIIRIILIVLLLINVAYVVVGTVTYPLNNVDVYGIWFLKAKAIYLSNGFPLDFLKDERYLYSHPQYPLLFPFFIAFIYSLVGGVKEIYPLLASPLVYSLILVVAYKVFRSIKFSDLLALVFTYIYSMFSPFLAEGGRKLSGTADIYLVLICWLVIYMVLTKRLSRNRGGWTLVFLVAVASQIKFEGVFISVLFLFLPINTRKKIIFFAVSFVPTIAWFILKNWFHILSDLYFKFYGAEEIMHRLVTIIASVGREMVNYRNWYFFWPLFFILILRYRQKTSLIRRIIIRTLTMMFLIFMAVYIFSNVDPYSYVSSSLDRVLFQLSPFWYLIFTDQAGRVLTMSTISSHYKLVGGDNSD